MHRILPAAFLALACASEARAGGITPDLMLASAWCSFTYNKTTGYSHSKRVQFARNGSWSSGSRGEGYSSGPGGSLASQRDASAGGAWNVFNGELLMSQGAGALQPVRTLVKRSSSGAPVIVADGVEYSQCR